MTTSGFGRRSWFTLVALLLIPGCLEFKKQTVILKFDEKSEKITISSVYEGFYVGRDLDTDKKESLTKAKDDLSKFVGDEQAFRFGKFWVGFGLKPIPNDSPETAANKRRLALIVDIGRGRLLLNEDGKLSGMQMVTIKDRTAFQKVSNEIISQEVAKTKATPDVSEKSLDLMHKAAAEGHQWLKIKPGQWVVDIPMTGEDADKRLASIKNDKKTSEQFAETLKSFGFFEVVKTDHGLAATFGDGKSHIMTVVFEDKVKVASMEAELLEFANTPPMSIDRSQDTKAVMEKFRSSR